ncbi:MICOS complex subunit MIC27 isoform X2 [Macrosteles quadrilineatus]|nr:MICOS complex subunit MIC27 isoform X2 [Macrosteles quadrilineatus]
MFNKMAIRKVVYPIASAGLFTASVAAAEEKKDEEKKQLIRRKDLSIYPAKKEEKIVTREEEDKPDSALMSAVRQVREAVWSAGKQVQGVSDSVNHVIETGKAHTASSIQILREDDHYLHRYGAITVGGLVGYVFAIRRGFFRKIIYTGTGATAVASVVYPEEAKEYSSEALAAAKKYIVVAYHFVNGVLRDYAGVQLPNLPGPLAVGSASAAEKDASTVPTSAALMPHTASAPSHINMPPLDVPSSVSDKKQG